MFRNSLILIGSLLMGNAAFAGDPEKGEKVFKKCKACHAIVADNGEGETIVKGGRSGPNLWGVIGRPVGSYPNYKYGKSILEANENGMVWDDANFVAFVKDTKKFWVEQLDDSAAKSKMSFKLSKGGEDVLSYLKSVGPEMTK